MRPGPGSGEGDERRRWPRPRAPLSACEQPRGQCPAGADRPAAAAAAAFLASSSSSFSSPLLTVQPLARLLWRGKVEAAGSGGSRLRRGGGTSRSWSAGPRRRRRRPRGLQLRGGGRSRLSPFRRLGTPESWSLPSSCLQHGGGGGGGTSRDPGRS